MTPARPRPARVVLIGHPVAHSRSYIFQDAALRAAGIPLEYGSVDVPPESLASVLNELKAQGAAGNVTIPHKEAVAEACDRLTPIAERVGAVNTFWVEGGLLWGDNTDVAGFDAAVVALGTPRKDAVVLCLGAGGAAAAVCGAIEGWPGARIRLSARSPERAERLVARFPHVATLAQDHPDRWAGVTLVVNATPVGLRDDVTPVAVAEIPRDADVMDLVYRAGDTAWVRAARAAGHRVLGGREMLLHQGARAFERWFGIAPDLHVMRRALEDAE
jgi:shikimate dehydrogenase